jgi:hypothetical protein
MAKATAAITIMQGTTISGFCNIVASGEKW